jgi:hypothetical protein
MPVTPLAVALATRSFLQRAQLRPQYLATCCRSHTLESQNSTSRIGEVIECQSPHPLPNGQLTWSMSSSPWAKLRASATTSKGTCSRRPPHEDFLCVRELQRRVPGVRRGGASKMIRH